MPTVLRFDGMRVVVYVNDHRPALVHVIRRGNEAEVVFNLKCPDGPSVLRENHGFTRQEVRRVRSVLRANLAALCDKWGIIHGQP